MPGIASAFSGDNVSAIIGPGEARSAYLFPSNVEKARGGAADLDDELFVFQYWPETVEDSYNPEYATKQIPGGSHPLYQWTGGSGRDITFTAQFTSEIDASRNVGSPSGQDVRFAALQPGLRYTVDVRAALNRIRSYMRGSYRNATAGGAGGGVNSLARPPKKLFLVLEGSGIGGTRDDILCILRSAPITHEAFFPNGRVRIAQVSMTFSEIVQIDEGDEAQIQFIGREVFEQDGAYYKYRGTVDKVV